MPFDDRTFPSHEAAAIRRRRTHVAIWLFTIAFMIWIMVVLGGTTRLTGSGLSIMEWAPLSGIVPPLTRADWNQLFALYKQIPQYALLHPGMGLAGFKGIFWLEWIHRFWGRLMGIMFIVPLIWFAATGAISRRMVPRLVGLFILGGLQGALGWFMVASGFFPDSIAVSAYRLVAHLTLALILFSAVLWTGLSTLSPVPVCIPDARFLRRLAIATTSLLALTIVAGGFTAGTHAGLIDNTFPLMDGRLFPAGYAQLHPFLLNLTQNVIAVQFDHRFLATLTATLAIITIAAGLRDSWRDRLPVSARFALAWLLAAVLTQYLLGVLTLLSAVAIPLAVAHQANAVILLASALTLTHCLRGAR